MDKKLSYWEFPEKRISKEVKVGSLIIGGGRRPVIQSMNNTDTRNVSETLAQIKRLHDEGCELTRLAVPDMKAAKALKEIMKDSVLPIVADIHFDYRLAIEALNAGAAKIRINPGNMKKEGLEKVIKLCKEKGSAVRIGVNSGSVSKSILEKYGKICPEALVDSAEETAELMEKQNFRNIVLSLKSSDPLMSIEAYRLAAKKFPYPLHLGITEAGTLREGSIRSAVGIGTLLSEGIGDTIRVSLSADPVEEVRAAISILKSLGMIKSGLTLITCPTCGRTEVDIIPLAAKIEKRLSHISKPITVAVMGCVVNGPGEAAGADIGIAGGRGFYQIFLKGNTVKKVREEEAEAALYSMIESCFGIKIP